MSAPPRRTVRSEWRAHRSLGRAYGAMTVLAAAIGLALILGGRDRVAGGAFSTLRATGGPLLWGVVLLVAAAALVVAIGLGVYAAAVALICCALVHGLLALWFLLAAVNDPLVAFLGAVVFGAVAFLHASMAVEHVW